MSEHALGIDLGASKIAAALTDRQGQVLVEKRVPTAAERGSTAVFQTLIDLLNSMLAQADAPVSGIGIGSPGRVDPQAGTVADAVNLGWDVLHLRADLEAALPAAPPIYLEKDANAEVLGEVYFGAGQGCRQVLYLGLGSGLGGGALVDGRLFHGASLTAVEIGHWAIDPHGFPCACGNRGCVETIVSGPGVVRLARWSVDQDIAPTSLTDKELHDPAAIVAAARRGDPLARKVFDQVGETLALAAAGYVSALNPARIIIGGGLGRAAFDLLVEPLKTRLQQQTYHTSYAALSLHCSQVTSSALGAACLVWHSQEENDDRI